MMAKIWLNLHLGVSDVQEVVGRVRGQSLALLIKQNKSKELIWNVSGSLQSRVIQECTPLGTQCCAAVWQRGEENSLHFRAFLE